MLGVAGRDRSGYSARSGQPAVRAADHAETWVSG